MLSIEDCPLNGIKYIKPKLFQDQRGFVAESYSQDRFIQHGMGPFIQENLSFSKEAGTLRGLHFQKPPYAQSKLIQVLRGKIFDVAVDIRQGSSTYGKHYGVTLSEKEQMFLYIPRGFAHGFYTLEDNTMILYKVDAYYAPQSEGGIKWDDPDLAINWPLLSGKVSLSEKDNALPSLKALDPMEW